MKAANEPRMEAPANKLRLGENSTNIYHSEPGHYVNPDNKNNTQMWGRNDGQNVDTTT